MTDQPRADRPLGGVPPAVQAICATIVFVVLSALISGLVAINRDPTTLLNILLLTFGGGSFVGTLATTVYAGKSARSSEQTRTALNGDFDTRVAAIVRRVLAEQLGDNPGEPSG